MILKSTSGDTLRVGWLNGFLFWEGTKRAEDAQGTPAQSHISPSILVYEGKIPLRMNHFRSNRERDVGRV